MASGSPRFHEPASDPLPDAAPDVLGAPATGAGVAGHARVISLCTFASRLTGLVRDVLLARVFGLGWVQDAFNYAFLIPNLFRRLLGEGALAPAFVPVFTQTLERESRPAAHQLMARTLALLTLALGAIVVVLELALLLAWNLASGADPQSVAARGLPLLLTALMLPFMITICVVALLSSVLNCLRSFALPALAPVVLNVFMIAALSGIGRWIAPQPERQVVLVALSVVAAGLAQVLLLAPLLARHGLPLRWSLALHDPNVRLMLGRLAPVALGQGVLMLGVFLDAQLCFLFTHAAGTPPTAEWFGVRFTLPLESGALSAITVAQRLYQFPLGVLGIALATAALPALSRLAMQQRMEAWRDELRTTLRAAIYQGLLAGGAMIALATPIVRLLFEYEAFDEADTQRASRAMIGYGLGMWAFFAQHIVLRAYYSLGDVKTPLRVSAALLPFNLLVSLSLLWLPPIREGAFAISAALTSSVGVLLLLARLQRATGQTVLDRAALAAIARMLAATLLALGAVAATRAYWFGGWIEASRASVAGRCLDTFASLLAAGALFVALSVAFRLPESAALLGHFRRPSSS